MDQKLCGDAKRKEEDRDRANYKIFSISLNYRLNKRRGMAGRVTERQSSC